MKILLATGIYPPDAGGPATYTCAMARALIERGHEAEVVCYADRDWDRRIGNDGKEAVLKVTRIYRDLPVLGRYFKYAFEVFKRARGADLVFLQGPVSEGLPGMIGALFARRPVVMKIVGDYAWEVFMQSTNDSKVEMLDDFVKSAHKDKIGWIQKIESWTARHASKVIVPSFYLKRIVRSWGVAREDIVVINNAVSIFPVGLERSVFRKANHLEEKKIIFTAVRAVPWKNIDFLIELIPALADDVVFVIAGEGPLYKQWQDLAQELDLEAKVRFVGKLNRREMREWYQAADVFVLPSGYEGFPHVVPEAAYFNLPCLVSDQGGNPETVHHFPQLVRVLPYLDKGAWISALNNTKIRRQIQFPDKLHFDQVVESTISVMKKVCKS